MIPLLVTALAAAGLIAAALRVVARDGYGRRPTRILYDSRHPEL